MCAKLTVDGAATRQAVDAYWLAEFDALLRGLTHALSNRIATISGAAYMLEHADVTMGEAASTLQQETERLDALLQLLRALPSRESDAAEPIVARDVVSQVVTLHSHRAELRDVPIRIDEAADVMPTWADPHALLQALALLLTAVKSSSAQGVLVQICGDNERIQLTLTTDGDTSAESTPSQARVEDGVDVANIAALLLAAHGGDAAQDETGYTITLPTLGAARRAGR